MKLWQRLATRGSESRDLDLTWNDYQSFFSYGGLDYPVIQTTANNLSEEGIAWNTQYAYRMNGIIYALVVARMQVFSQIRFQWTAFQGSQPGDLFGTQALKLLETPWVGGCTADLLARMELDVSTSGNAYVRKISPTRLSCLRPEWVTIVLGSREDTDHPEYAADVEIAGYIYRPPDGPGMQVFLPNEIAHYAPYPDPAFSFLGISWVTPVLREMQADSLATEHKAQFFKSAAPQPLTARVLTPSGWSTMGAMTVGSDVIGADGKAHKVTGVYPQGTRTIYRVRFSDGSSTECTADHVWTVSSIYDRKHGVTRDLSLQEMLDGGLRYPSGPAKWAVQLADPIEYRPVAELTVDPYLMGLLLGDGSFRANSHGSGGVSLACHADDVDETEEAVSAALPQNVSISRRDRGGWSELYFRRELHSDRSNALTDEIKALGLWDKPGSEKFIPECYLRGDVKDRVALMQGLIDSDGHVDSGTVRFTTTSRRLAADLSELVKSLGGCSRVSGNRGRSTLTVSVTRLPGWIIPARLSRKAEAYRPYAHHRVRYITDAEIVGISEAQCIRVDASDNLYVTDDFIVTHNTPNMAVKFDKGTTTQQIRDFKELFEEDHVGAWNAYKTLYLGGGADVTVVGKDFRELDFAATQGKGESRLAAAAGVPPSWVGFSEGLQGSALNAGNFNSARRRFSDATMVHLWTNAANTLDQLVRPKPPNGSLWYDVRIPFMREDAGDLAAIQQKEASTIRTLVETGYEPDTVIAAVKNNDWQLLKHSGLTSVQLQPPQSEPDLAFLGEAPATPAPTNNPPPPNKGSSNGTGSKSG